MGSPVTYVQYVPDHYLVVCGVWEQSLNWSWNWLDWAVQTGRKKRKQRVINKIPLKQTDISSIQFLTNINTIQYLVQIIAMLTTFMS